MLQKRYIMLELLRKNHNHVRGIAKELSTNQTSIARKLKQLEKENIVDYREEGRNKVYYLKETLEAKESLKILEHKKQIEIISKYPRLRSIFNEIKSKEKIQLAILFGSYAKGIQTKKSDIDIYIETQDRNLQKQLKLIDSKLSIKIGKFDIKSHLAQEIIKNHIIVKGVEKFYELIS